MLQPLRSSEDVLNAVVEALPMQPESGADLQQQLLDYLQDKCLLLILDNFEHLLDGVDLLIEILDAAPQVKVLATSREALNLRKEWVRRLRGLDYPEDETVAPLTSYSGVKLFVERARQQRGDFSLDAEAGEVIRICQLVEGLPLALELAAGWTRSLSCAAIADEIQARIDFLARNARDVPERHRSIRAVFDQSWRLLSPHEASVMRGFAVFRGGCTREASTTILGTSLETLARLVDKSLLHYNGETGRYDVQELQRQYAKEQLDNTGEGDHLRDRHCHYYGEFFHAREPAEHLHTVHMELDNIRAAWAWALECEHYEVIDQLLDTLWSYFTDYTMAFELGAMTQAASKQLANCTNPEERAIFGRVLSRQAKWAVKYGRVEQAEALFRQSMAIAREQDNLAEYYYSFRWLALHILGMHHLDYATSHTMLQECVAFYRERDDKRAKMALAVSLGNLAEICGAVGQVEQQEALWQESYRIYEQFNYQHGMAEALRFLGKLTSNAGRWSESEQHLLAAKDLEWERKGKTVQNSTPLTAMEIAYVAMMQGDFPKAEQWIKVALAPLLAAHSGLMTNFEVRLSCQLTDCLIADARGASPTTLRQVDEVFIQVEQRGGLQEMLDRCRLIYSWVCCNSNDFDTAANAFPEVLASACSSQRTADILFAIATAARIVAYREQHSRAVELLGLAFSHPNSPHGYFENHQGMTRLRSRLRAMLGADAYAAAWERGAALEIEQVASDLLHQFTSGGQDPIAEANQSLPDPLTPRELDVLTLLGEGLSNPQIAERLFVSTGTVKSHTNRLYNKLAVANRAQAIVRAQELCLL